MKKKNKKNYSSIIFTWLMIMMLIFQFTILHTSAASNENIVSMRVIIDSKVNVYDAVIYNASPYFTAKNVKKMLPDIDISGIKPVTVNGAQVYSLNEAARLLDISFRYDDVLKAVYIWRQFTYYTSADEEIARAVYFGLVPTTARQNLDAQITSKEFAEMLIRFVEKTDASKLAKWKEIAKLVLVSERKIDYEDAMFALSIAGELVGRNFLTRPSESLNEAVFEKFGEKGFHFRFDYPEWPESVWKRPVTLQGGTVYRVDSPFPSDDQRQYWTSDNFANFSWDFAMSKASSYNAMPLIVFGNKNFNSPLSRRDAIKAVDRLYESPQPLNLIPYEQAAAKTYDKNIIPASLLKNAEWLPTPTVKEFPYYTGFAYSDIGRHYYEQDFRAISEWGFNHIRFIIATSSFLCNRDVTVIDEGYLKELDEVVSWALRYGLHVNFQFGTFPGREVYWIGEKGEYDLNISNYDYYTKSMYQQRVTRIWELLAKRYKGIPNNNLSFNINYEPNNRSISSTMEPSQHTDKQIHDVTKALITAIHAVDSNRLLLFEGAQNGELMTWLADLNAVQVYKGVEWGAGLIFDGWLGMDDIMDSGAVPKYQSASINDTINTDAPMIFKGDFHKGTEFTLELYEIHGLPQFVAEADGKEFFKKQFSTSDRNSKDKPYKLKITLDRDAKEVVFSFAGKDEGLGCWWRNLEVTLPKPYTFNNWYYVRDSRSFIKKPSSNYTMDMYDPSPERRANIFIVNEDGITSVPETPGSNPFNRFNEKTDAIFTLAKKYGISPGMNIEDFCPVWPASSDVVLCFHDILSSFKEHGIGWNTTIFPLLLGVSEADHSSFANAKTVPYPWFHPLPHGEI
jgi:hypothetical protein